MPLVTVPFVVAFVTVTVGKAVNVVGVGDVELAGPMLDPDVCVTVAGVVDVTTLDPVVEVGAGVVVSTTT